MRVLVVLAVMAVALPALARDLSGLAPPYPRIGNCYGAGLAWRPLPEGLEYWSKVDLILGGCYDLHYDWEHQRWGKVLTELEQRIPKIREANPHVLILPYVDVVEGPDNPAVPQPWWDLRNGERWSGWPGFFRINTKLPEVLEYNLAKVRDEILGRECFDGVFYDCWGPDPWLVPRTAQLRDGQAIVMVNDWNLPREGFAHLNGCLSEDELNRVVEGKVDFEEFLARYLRWCRESRRPLTTMLVCHPRTTGDDPWGNSKRTREQKEALKEQARTADPAMLRFGLATTLMGDGYFGYDGGNGLSRGNWWWYPEYDLPLGQPKGDAARQPDGTWRREFDGATVITNGSGYDCVVTLPRKVKDFSTGRVGTRFTIPSWDGRFYLPTAEPATAGEDQPPRLTREPPAQLRLAELDGGQRVVQTPGGLDLRLGASGEVKTIRLGGRNVLGGGWPGVYAPPMMRFAVADTTVEATADAGAAKLVFAGTFVQDAQRVAYRETVTVRPDNQFTLRYEFTAQTALELRMWRHFFTLPVDQYAGATATSGGQTLKLPETLGTEALLSGVTDLQVAGRDAKLTIRSSLPLGLVDHRKWGTPEYLLAGYPVSGQVEAGRTWTVEQTVTVQAP